MYKRRNSGRKHFILNEFVISGLLLIGLITLAMSDDRWAVTEKNMMDKKEQQPQLIGETLGYKKSKDPWVDQSELSSDVDHLARLSTKKLNESSKLMYLQLDERSNDKKDKPKLPLKQAV